MDCTFLSEEFPIILLYENVQLQWEPLDALSVCVERGRGVFDFV